MGFRAPFHFAVCPRSLLPIRRKAIRSGKGAHAVSERYRVEDLKKFATAMLCAAGQDPVQARAVADTLVEADLLGYTTHGIQFLPQYCAALENGAMAPRGEVAVVRDEGDALLLDGGMLAGPWCMRHAVRMALERAGDHGAVTALVRRAHNTACLATYLLPVVEAGMIGLTFVSGVGNRAVAPPGGKAGRYSTNPLAAGFPTRDDPVLIDMATSATTNRLTERLAREGKSHRGAPMLDAEGNPSDDPLVLVRGGGAIRPLGGDVNEHKGYALALMIEALSACLSGGGRAWAEASGQPGGSAAFIQIINPDRFAGREAFLNEISFLADYLKDTPARPGSDGVRVPGQRAFAARRDHLARGVVLEPSIRPHVEPAARRYGLAFPDPVGSEAPR
ncbi:MAG: Ldh family oxidoreductase [Alphaproteobacteria bacterium]|nr:MAG: Ldh family oxidoreductase [Alphaproteobacteria bacterium]